MYLLQLCCLICTREKESAVDAFDNDHGFSNYYEITSIDQLAKLIGKAGKGALKSLVNQDYLHIHHHHHPAPNSSSLSPTKIIKSTAIIIGTAITMAIISIIIIIIIIIITTTTTIVVVVIIIFTLVFFMCNTYLLPRL